MTSDEDDLERGSGRLDDGNHARAAGNKVRDRGCRLWSPRGLRLNHPPTPSKLSVGELLLLLISSSSKTASDRKTCVACFVLVKQRKMAASEKVICL